MYNHIDILKKLLQVHSTDINVEEKEKIITFVSSLFDKEGYYIHIENVNNNYNLFVTNNNQVITSWQSWKSINIDFSVCCHLDIVDAQDHMFSFNDDEEYIYGRWSLDMKWASSVVISSFLDNAKKILSSEDKILLLFTTDEETWAKDGIQYIAWKNIFHFNTCVVPDTWEWNNKILYRWKWFLFVEMNALWKSSHWCRPWSWSNAIELLIEEYNLFKEYIISLNDSWDNSFNTVSINLWILWGWDAPNKVPDSAYAKIDIRFPPGKNYENIIVSWIKDRWLMNEKIDYNIRSLFEWFWEKKDMIDNTFVKCIQEVCGDIELYDEFWSNDWRYLVHSTDNLVMIWPKWYDFHGDNERVLKVELLNFFTILNNFINKYL